MYKSLETIPYKIFFKIYETKNFYLLNKVDKNFEDFSNDELQKFEIIWQKIKKEYLELSKSDDDSRVFDIEKEIDYLESKYKLIQMCCECLAFDWNDECVLIIRDNDFVITDENYYEDLELILLQSESIIHSIENFRTQLPKEKTHAKKNTIDDMLASISAVLGIAFDFNTISFTAVNSYLIQVQAKIKSLENK